MESLNYDEEDNYSDIKPARFLNEKEFNKELEEILQVTKDYTVDWKKRESALKKLGAIFLSDYGSNPSFIKSFNQKIYLNLSTQMLDLRSGLMKEACRIATLAAKVYGQKIETAAERLVSPMVLYKLVNSANKLLSDAGAICISQIIKNVESGKIITRIHEQMKNKSNTVRLRASQHLLIILDNYSINSLSRSAALIEEFITSTTHDANMDVRIHGRKLYYKYSELFPNLANKLFNNFEHNVQKTINDELNNQNGGHSEYNRKGSFQCEEYSDEESVISNISVANPKIKSKRSSDNQSLTNFNTYNVNETKSFSSSVKSGVNNLQRNSTVCDFNGKLSTTMPRKTSNLNADHIEIKPFSKTEKKEVLTRLNSMKIGTSFSINTDATSHTASKTQTQNQKISINKIRSMTDQHLNTETVNNSNKQSSISSNGHIKRNSLTNLGLGQYLTDKPKYKNIEDLIKLKINTILQPKKIEDSVRIKLEAFEEISHYFNEIYSNSDYISKTTLKNLMSVHIANLSEDSYKLIVQIMKNITKFIFYIDGIFSEDDISIIIKSVIFNISSDIEEISQNATALLEIIRKKLDVNMIIKPFIEIIKIDTTEFVILEICFEFVNPLIELAVTSLSDQIYLTNFVIDIARILRRLETESDSDPNVKDLMSKVLDCYELIYKKYPKQFIACFKSDKFPSELKTMVIKIMNMSNKKNIAENIKQNIESNNHNCNYTSKSNTNSLNNTLNFSYSTNPNSYNNDVVNTNSLSNYTSNTNQFKSSNNYYSTNQNGYNYDENLNFKNVNYDVLKIAYETKLNSFVDYLNSDPNFNTENFLLALNRVKYEQVFFILNHIYYILDSEEHKYLFGDNLSLFINRIIFLLDKFYTEYSEQIKEIINLIPVKLDKEMFLQLLPKYITNRQSPHIVQILLLSINNVINEIEQENLLLLLPSFIETVFNTLNHNISDVRKYAVYCIVDLYLILGKDFDAYLNELNPSQKNLINIYVRKKLENNNY